MVPFGIIGFVSLLFCILCAFCICLIPGMLLVLHCISIFVILLIRLLIELMRVLLSLVWISLWQMLMLTLWSWRIVLLLWIMLFVQRILCMGCLCSLFLPFGFLHILFFLFGNICLSICKCFSLVLKMKIGVLIFLIYMLLCIVVYVLRLVRLFGMQSLLRVVGNSVLVALWNTLILLLLRLLLVPLVWISIWIFLLLLCLLLFLPFVSLSFLFFVFL